ncbi:MAG: hypothetical protein KAY32_12560 [Candidatus Eisenbacteria sp.]|nr:hypothetical protein [Candidatus Eisenbacteria bacterium]
MGLFGGLFGKPAAMEEKADGVLASGDPLEAYRLYRSALRKTGGKDPAATERLQGKAHDAHQRFVRLKLDEAERMIEDRVLDAAEESLEIARDHLEQGDTRLRGEVEALATRLSSLADTFEAPGHDAEQRDAPAPDAPGIPTTQEEYLSTPEASLSETDPLTAYLMYSGALAPADRERAERFGEDFKRAFVAYQQGDRQAALDGFTAELEKHPDEPLLLEHVGLLLDQLDRQGEARRHFERALKTDPHRINARLALAEMLAGTGSHGQAQQPRDPAGARAALKLLAEGARIDPEHQVAYAVTHAEVMIAAGRAAEAVPQIEKLMEAGLDRDPGLWQLYAAALEAQGELDDAEEAYERVVQLSGHAMAPRGLFAEFALRHGRALKYAEKMIFETCLGCQATRPSEAQLDRYGVLLTRIQLARGQTKAALAGVERLLAKGPPPDLTPMLERLRSEARARLASET